MNNQNNQQLDQLASLLKSVEKPLLAEENKMHLKMRVLNGIDLPVVDYVKNTQKSFELPLYKRILMKERLMSKIADTVQIQFNWAAFFEFNKKVLSAFLMFLMVFGLFSFVNINTNVVRAASFTTLDDYDGDVAVYRGGDFVNVEKGMRIYEDDSLMTGERSYATVKFFDDSVSRLDSLTEVVVKKLSKPTQSVVSSHVEVTVKGGNVWSNVVNLLDEDDSSFSVEAGDLYLTTKKAAFNVEVDESGVEVGVFNNDVS